jgi:hypothetical protein
LFLNLCLSVFICGRPGLQLGWISQPGFCNIEFVADIAASRALVRTALSCVLLSCAACSKPPKPIVDLSGSENLSAYTLTMVRGHRDGDLLTAQAGFSDGPSALLVDLRFKIDTSAQLQSGRWRWVSAGHIQKSGSVAARSVMFLGGQNGSPSIGGTYDLLDANGVAAYRIAIPTTQLESHLPNVPSESR